MIFFLFFLQYSHIVKPCFLILEFQVFNNKFHSSKQIKNVLLFFAAVLLDGVDISSDPAL